MVSVHALGVVCLLAHSNSRSSNRKLPSNASGLDARSPFLSGWRRQGWKDDEMKTKRSVGDEKNHNMAENSQLSEGKMARKKPRPRVGRNADKRDGWRCTGSSLW
eukprot:scaffold8358_cov70-Attheya_sp.AAC.3